MVAIRRCIHFVASLAGFGLVSQGCSSDSTAFQERASRGETFRVAVGQELTITLQTVGPGTYDSIPVVSSSVVRFLRASIVPPYVPAGPTQRFDFRAITPGSATITFPHSGSNHIVMDTVIVR